MLKRHEDALSQRVDAVAYKGFSFIESWELKAWYGQERINKSVWRDLRDRLRDAPHSEAAELYVYDYDKNGGVMLIHWDALKKIMPDGSRQNVSDKLEPALETANAE